MAVQPTGEEVELAQVVTPPPAETQLADRACSGRQSTASDDRESAAADRAVRMLALGGALALRFVERRVL